MTAKKFHADAAFKVHAVSWKNYKAVACGNENISARMQKLTEIDYSRGDDFGTRRVRELKNIPVKSTTMIGSFLQTEIIRKLQTQRKKDLLYKPEYNVAIDQKIAYDIEMQEVHGLDILVHSEGERTDMVKFFAQKMDGMLFTTSGWV